MKSREREREREKGGRKAGRKSGTGAAGVHHLPTLEVYFPTRLQFW